MNSQNRPAKIVVGCEQLGGTDWGDVDRMAVQAAISDAFDAGLHAFDTADVYGLGESERRLAEALGSRRHDAFIITKGGVRWEKTGGRANTWKDNDPDYLTRAIESSLKRLQIDRIGLYLVHWPDNRTELARVMDCLQEAKVAGKIERYGLSNFPIDDCIDAAGNGADAVQTGFNLLSGENERARLNKMGKAGLSRYGYGVLAQGLLSGKYDSQSRFADNDRRHRLLHFQKENWPATSRLLDRLGLVAAAHGVTIADVAIQSVRQSGWLEAVIVGLKTRDQARSLARLSDFTLSTEAVSKVWER